MSAKLGNDAIRSDTGGFFSCSKFIYSINYAAQAYLLRLAAASKIKPARNCELVLFYFSSSIFTHPNVQVQAVFVPRPLIDVIRVIFLFPDVV